MAPGRSQKSAESRRSMAAQAFTGDFLRGDRSKCRDSHGLLNACRCSERRVALRSATNSPSQRFAGAMRETARTRLVAIGEVQISLSPKYPVRTGFG
jgi:hypothetical protein